MAASSSSSSAHIKRYHVFPSFHGPDVRRGFLSHFHKLFTNKGIMTFKDDEIERGHTIGPELVRAIRESRVSIVLLSKNYASSSWCLDELVEILKCREDPRQSVMTVFYEVDPSDVRNQSGKFGRAFLKTCEGKTEEVKQKWIKALADVAIIAGEHLLNWDNEADMIEKITTDVLNKVTLSMHFDGMVGLDAHLRKVNSLLPPECNEVKMIGIWGPAGIGKSTIARALYSLLSIDFPRRCLMSISGADDSDKSKLHLQNELLSKILNQTDMMRIHHLGAIKENLKDQRVLIILDDVDDIEKLEALAKEVSWFGPGSRIIVTTKDKRILKAHGINDIYHVDFPSKEEALEILCLSTFKQSSPQDGFEELANNVVKICSNLPLALGVVGSSLRGESKDEWELQLHRLETSLDRKIEDVLRVGFDRLSKDDQSLFFHIACFFNNEAVSLLNTLEDKSTLSHVGKGLKTLEDKSLVHISTDGRIVMPDLLQQLGRQMVREMSHEHGKRLIKVHDKAIKYEVANETGTKSAISISHDLSKIGKLNGNLRFKFGDRFGISFETRGSTAEMRLLRLSIWKRDKSIHPVSKTRRDFNYYFLKRNKINNSKM